MDDQYYWAIYYASVCAIQFHPKNDRDANGNSFGTAWDQARIKRSAEIATQMLTEHHKRWPVDKGD